MPTATMVSYAQNYEDVVLARVFAGQKCGFYVDIGANHPVRDSVTKHFSDHGWRGVNVEPGRIFADLAAARPRDVNLNVACSGHDGSVTFYESESPGLSGLSPDVPEYLKWISGARNAKTIPALRLETILSHSGSSEVDFLSIDVEGHERTVLASNDWHVRRPRVVLVEATRPGTQTPSHQDWESILLNAEYRFVYFDGLNRFYVRSEDHESLAPRFGPPCIFDRFISVEMAALRAGHPDVGAAV